MTARPNRRSIAAALALLGVLGATTPSAHAANVSISGDALRGPVEADSEGRFGFNQVPLRQNAVNRFTVTATDDTGASVSSDLAITQLSLQQIVVAQIRSERLSIERIEQLVADGVIDIDDPENFNVSTFAIVLTIGGREVPISVPIVRATEEVIGTETYQVPNDPGGRPGNPRTEVVVFEVEPPGIPGEPPPPRIPGVLIIQGDIKTLKEFFSVRLLLLNTSGIFTLSDVTAMVAFPDGGLSATLPSDGLANFGEILPGPPDEPGQKEREFIIRGDEIGNNRVRVEFGGHITGPGIGEDSPIPFNGAAETTLEVKGPPSFDVRVFHPDAVEAHVPYTLQVEITNTSDVPALYSSLDLDVGADGELLRCEVPEGATEPVCERIEGKETRILGHLLPGQRVRESFLIEPFSTGPITSCTGASDQNIRLQVHVGNIGCITGHFPPRRSNPDGRPTVAVIPTPGALGVSIEAPVTLFFSEAMDESSLPGSLQVLDETGAAAPGRVRVLTLLDRSVALWQFEDGITNRLAGNSEYQVVVSQVARDLEGNTLANEWTSTFRTTDPTDDETPPALELSIEPGVDPLRVLPGQVVQVNAYAADQGTGVSRVELRLRDESVADAPYLFIDQKTVFGADAGPCLFSIDSASLVPGHTYQLLATAFDGAGNLQDATIPFVLLTTTAAPTLTLPEDPDAPILQGVSVQLTPLFVASTTKLVAFFLDADAVPFATVSLPPFQASIPTLELPLGDHVVRAIATDALDQTGEDTLAFTLVENPSEPVIDFGSAVDGAEVLRGAAFAVNANANDPVGIASLAFYLDAVGGTPLAFGTQPFSVDTAELAPGLHRVVALAENRLGVSNDPGDPGSALEFLVVEPGSDEPPPAPTLASVSTPQDAAGGGTESIVIGSAFPGGRVDARNTTTGVAISTHANASGAFEVRIAASAGDALELSVLALSVSAQPSAVVQAIVPAAPTLTGLRIAPETVTLLARDAVQDLVVTGLYAGAPDADVTADAIYSSSAPGVASVSSSGRVVALASGSAQITARIGALAASTGVTVSIRTLQSISVDPPSVTLPAIGATQALSVIGHFSDGTTELLAGGLAFSSSAPAVIGVTGGVVRALAVGSAIVHVSASGVPPVQVPVEVDTGLDDPPTVAFLSPAAGTGYERGQNVGVSASATDAIGVTRVTLTASGAATFSETRPITPAATSANASFSFPMPSDALLGGTVTLTLSAEDTGGNLSTLATRSITVVDRTDPVVSISAPAVDTTYGYDDEVEVVIAASDSVGVAEIRYDIAGIAGASGTQAIAPPQTSAGATFTFRIPIGLVAPQVEIRAYAVDTSGNEGVSAPVPITITDADTTAPETVATSAGAPSGATTTIAYEVTAGLADLDHVELYFRRNGLGTFSRYTGPLGTGTGEFTPQGDASGTIAFDATRMGGDGAYEFFTVGVDHAGNRETPPEDAGAIAGDPGVTATIATGALVTTIAANTEIVGPEFDGLNLRVTGATLTVVGAHTFGNVELLNGAVLTHRETTQTDAFGVELTAWTLSVDATSRVDVVGRGHLGGNRAGLEEVAHTSGFAAGAQRGSGGSYGGLGGDYSGNGANVPNPVYGNLANPVDLGSGGGAFSGAGGDGGGRVLIGAINLVVDGSIIANGGLSAGSASGEGSGGSVNLTLRTLSGRGAIAADGGTTNGSDHTGGGGGRIAVRSLDRATYDASSITARGGDGFYGDGAEGTVFLLGEGQTGGELVINGLGASSPITDLIIPPGQGFDSITLQNGANVIAQGPIMLTETLRLRGNSRLAHPTANETGLAITAREVIVESGSAIDVTGRGYLGGGKAGLGDTAHTLGFVAGSQRGSGGSHGGVGADYAGNGANIPTSVYGDPKRPNRLGAGGGSFSGAGGDGGGFVRIVASDRVVVDGAIRANGGLSAGSASGEGAGGSVWIDTARLAGIGSVSADGGTTNGSDHTGGGGGRVAIHAEFVDPNADLGDLRNLTARGGDGFYGDGAAGTVYVHVTGDVVGTLFIDGVMPVGQTQALATELPPIGPGVAAAVTADSLTVDGALPAFTPNALVGLRLDPSGDQVETFEVASNTADTITVVTPNENGVAFASVAVAGAAYAGSWHFDAIHVLRGGFLEAGDPLFVAENLSLADGAWLTHTETTQAYAGDLVIDAGTVTIDGTSRIDVTGRGYLGGNRAGLGTTAHTVGFTPGAQNGTGASHGGVGGKFSGSGASVTNPTYGNLSAPRELGAGGGAFSGAGGDGGGRVAIVADAMVVDGALRADGGISSGSASGEGAGGSLELQVGSLSGSGVISASGGTQGGLDHTGAGGGRIAIRHGGNFTFALDNVRAVGGDGFYGDGGHGSVFVLGPGQTYGDVIVDGHGFTPPADSVVLPADLTADNLILRDGVRAVAGRIEADTVRLESGATLAHAPQSALGLAIDVRQLVVASGAVIDVTGRGHLGGGKAGLGDIAHTLNATPGSEAGSGGSHGGRGGDYASNGARVPSAIYGDPRRPAQLGGGGGSWSGDGGDGGGVVRVIASESVTIDGAIRANGGISDGSASGEGAGGSVWIETGTFGGVGSIAADGGTTNGSAHTGGGGGRVAIHADALDAASDLFAARRATAYGGDGFYGDGAPGTVYVAIGEAETLIFDAGRTGERWTPETSLPPVGPGIAANVTSDSFDVDGNLPPPGIRDYHVGGLRVNPNTAQDESFAIETNIASTVNVRTPNENGVHFAAVALDGASYAGVWRFANVLLRGGVSVALFEPIAIDGTFDVTEHALLTHPDTTMVYASALEIEGGTLSIDATSEIDVSARGYLGGDRNGLVDTGHTLGFAPGAEAGSGGSYGGLGGDYSANGARGPNPVYGDPSEPLELGSGGGAWSGVGGDGGGRVRIDVGALILDGAIRANGGLSSGSASGEGSGGAVNVRAGSVAGGGSISADGGTTGGTAHTGGGGGRIAIRTATGPLPISNSVSGGDGFYGDGQPGTVFIDTP